MADGEDAKVVAAAQGHLSGFAWRNLKHLNLFDHSSFEWKQWSCPLLTGIHLCSYKLSPTLILGKIKWMRCNKILSNFCPSVFPEDCWMFPSFTKHLHLNSIPPSLFSFNLRLIKDSRELETTAEIYLKPQHVQFTVDGAQRFANKCMWFR